MADIKLSFPVRKSGRLSSKQNREKLLQKCDAEIVITKSPPSFEDDPAKSHTSKLSPMKRKSDDENELSRDYISPAKAGPQSINDTSMKTCCSPMLSPTKRKTDDENEFSRDCISPVKTRQPLVKDTSTMKSCYSPMLSPAKRKIDDENEFSGDCISPVKARQPSVSDTFMKSCLSPMLSPMKRKSDDGKFSSDCISPVKTRRPSVNDISSVKSGLSVLSPISPLRNHCSPIGTPKSSRRPSKILSSVPTSTPRRLFSSPSKLDSKSEVGTPVSEMLTPHKSLFSPSRLSTPPRQRSAAKPYLSAKRCLHTAKPDRLIGRDSEFAEIEDFICDKLDNDSSGSLYVSGAPGTGKTVVVNYVISKLQSEYEGLRTAFINCMTLKDPSAVFQQIHEQLIDSPPKPKDSIRAVETLFTNSNDCILVVLDEIDQLDSKHHHILYRIFEWPALKNSKLILIGIANALDLTDRVLPRLQASETCRPTLLNFRPYTSVQITDILKHRLQRDCVVEPSAVNFCARKVSAVAGDVRKALDICRRAVEMVESESRCQLILKPTDCNSPTKKDPQTTLKKVTITHISKVMSDVYGSSVSATNSSENDVPLHQKLAVCTLLVLIKSGKLKEVQLGKIHEAYSKVCRHQQLVPVDQSEFSCVLSLLDSRGVVMMKKAKDTRLTKVSLKLDEQELEQTLKDKVLMAAILKNGIPK